MLSVDSLRSALSTERSNAYAKSGDADEVDSVARYLWNLALCSAIQPAIHTLEATSAITSSRFRAGSWKAGTRDTDTVRFPAGSTPGHPVFSDTSTRPWSVQRRCSGIEAGR